MNAIWAIAYRSLKKSGLQTGFEPATLRYRCDAPTDWALKPLTLGAGHLWVLMNPWRMDVKWYMKCFIYWTHNWPAPNVGGFIAQLVRASHRYREVTGSNPVWGLDFFRHLYAIACSNCIHNCDDHSLLDFKSAVQYMKHFIYHFTKLFVL